MKKLFISMILVFMAFDMSLGQNTPCKNSQHILKQSATWHDPDNQWETLQATFHIQEPRLSNPQRFSIVDFDNAAQTFVLQRNRDEHMSTHSVDAEGNPKVLLDNQENIPAELVEKYFLDPQRSFGYRDFYTLSYGLPMSLKADKIKMMKPATPAVFNEKEALAVELELQKPIISPHWRLFFTQDNYKLIGLELFDPENPEEGEKIILDGSIEVQGIRIPRMRHWYELNSDIYSGSDIIVKKVEE